MGCKPRKGDHVKSNKIVNTFTVGQDSIDINIYPPTSMYVMSFDIKYYAYWNDTIIDRGVKLSAREYNTSDHIEYYGGPLRFSFKKYKASVYFVKEEIVFNGIMK